MARFAGPSHNGTAVTCARIHKTPTSHADVSTTPLRDIGPPQLRPRVEDTIGPSARRSIIAARLGESMQSRRWRSGSVRPSDPARGGPVLARRPCRVAGSALRRNTPPGGLVGAVLHGREAGWSFPSGDDTSVRSRLIRCRALRPSPLKKVQGDGSCAWVLVGAGVLVVGRRHEVRNRVRVLVHRGTAGGEAGCACRAGRRHRARAH